jgi:hypothetical protein
MEAVLVAADTEETRVLRPDDESPSKGTTALQTRTFVCLEHFCYNLKKN